jgi:hypothetical protein
LSKLPVFQRPGQGGGEYPQNAAGHGRRHPGHPHQTGRSSPQHADPAISQARPKKKNRQGNPGHLCAHCRAPGHLLDQEPSWKIVLSALNPEPIEDIRIKQLVDKDKEERENYVETVKDYIQKKLDENSLKAQVNGTLQALLLSIHQKMLQQNLPFEEVYDIIAFQDHPGHHSPMLRSPGLMHSLWRPIAKKFKDYIGMPKPNMYQSLHTTVIGPFWRTHRNPDPHP